MAKMITLSAYDCVEVDGYLYFFSREYNFLFKLEITTGEITIVDSIPEEKLFEGQLCSKIIRYEDYLYLAPMNAKKIWKYSLKDGTWKGYELEKKDGFKGEQAFFQAVLYNDKIFLFGCRYPALVVFDTRNEEIQYLENMFEGNMKKLAISNNDIFFRKDCVRIDNYVYIASCVNNSVLKFNMDTYDYEYVTVGDKNNRYSGIGYDGSDFYLSPRRKTDAVRWNGNDGYESIKLKYSNLEDTNTIRGVFCDEEKVIFYGNLKDDSYVVYKNDNKAKCAPSEKYLFYEHINTDKLVSLKCDGNLKIKKEDEEFDYGLQVEEKMIEDYIAYKIKIKDTDFSCLSECNENGVVIENEKFSLKVFTKII